MASIIDFGKDWYNDASGQLRRADPLLMGAAFAFNALFAIVPLAIAFVSALTMFDWTQQIVADLVEAMNEALPQDVALFLTQIVDESVSAVEDNRVIILFISVPIALWSGSRAVYTVQKALRLIDDSGEEIGYVRMRVTGILVTFGAGVAVVVAYVLGVMGRTFFETVAREFGRQSQARAQLVMLAVAVLWVFMLLYVVYRWGAPEPVPKTAATSMLVTVVLFAGSWFALNLLPSEASASIAVFGAMGVILFWLYAVGIVIVGAPIAIGSLMRVLSSDRHR